MRAHDDNPPGVFEAACEGVAMRAFLQRSDLGLRRLLSVRRAALRCRSLYSGTTYRALKLRHMIGVRLDQVLIVERGSHRILDEWSGGSKSRMEDEKAAPGKATAMMLAAIGAFARDSKAVFHGGISSLDLGRTHVQLYATPTYVLGARYGGPALGKLDQHIDAALRNALRATPELLHWIGGAPEDLKGTAGKIASTLEKLLLDANLHAPWRGATSNLCLCDDRRALPRQHHRNRRCHH